MTECDIRMFLTAFAAAWAARDGAAFAALWHPDGVLHSPLVDRPVQGSEVQRLNDLQYERAPNLVWQLLDWAWRDDIVIVEWQSSRLIDGARFDWRGVDKLRLREGRIVEEWVYMDTALLRALRTAEDRAAVARAARSGAAFEAMMAI